MKTLVITTFALSVLLSPAHAQTPAAAPAQTAAQRAATYKGPKVVKDSKALGKKMVQKSKPADGVQTRVRELPVKK